MSHLRVIDGSTQLAFNYDGVSAEVAIEARQAAERISLRLRRTAEDIIEIGRDLLTVKERLPHGSFLPWIEAEFGMAERTAQKFMSVAKAVGSKSARYADLTPQALYELATPKTPLEVREEVEKMLAAGEVVSAATIAEMKRERQEAERAAEQTIATLTARNTELANTLAAAEEADPELALDAARDAGRTAGEQAAEARLTGRINDLSAANVALQQDSEKLRTDLAAMKAEREAQKVATAANVVALPVAEQTPDEDDDADDEASRIEAFSGALGSMFGLEFDVTAFWKQQSKTGSHSKRIHRALLSVNAMIGNLILEHSK